MKPEPDPEMCVWCDRGADVASPVGPLCERCGQDLAEDLDP